MSVNRATDAPRVLVVEDTSTDREVISRALRSAGMLCAEASSLRDAAAAARYSRPDLVVLDLMMPDGNGLEVIPAICEAGAPVIVCSADPRENVRVACLEAGAADFLTKPFSARELAIRAARAVNGRTERVPRNGEGPTVELDPDVRCAVVGGRSILLAPKEYALLEVLMRSRGQLVTRDRLLEEVWGPERTPGPATVVEHMRRLRGKIEPDPRKPALILSERGKGYRLV